MYKYKNSDIELKNFQQVFASQINIKTLSIGLFVFTSIALILVANFVVFANYEKSDAVNNFENSLENGSTSRINNLSYINKSNELCNWDCYPKNTSCYRRENPVGSGHYDMFTLVAHTSMGDAIGDATCQDPGLCEPGNYDILHCYERGGTWGVPGDSSGWCVVTYTGYWDGYHHWSVTNEGHQTTGNYQRWIGEFRAPAYGYIDVSKWSTWSESYINTNYSFKDCKYYIYSSFSDAQNRVNPIDVIVLDKYGYGKCRTSFRAEEIFYVRESNKPGEHGLGYKVNDDIGTVKIVPDETTRVTWSNGELVTYDEPLLGELPITITKTDAQTLEPSVCEGSVTDFSEAYYCIEYKGNPYLDSSLNNAESNRRQWIFKTDEKGQVSISEKYRDNKVYGDDFFECQGKIVAPLGVYSVQEVEPPEGYLLSDHTYIATLSADDYSPTGLKTVFIDEKTGQNIEQILDPQTGINSVSVLEQVIRGDYKFTKINNDNETLAGIPFKITSKTTGEWHIVVTDKNGIVDTSSNHYLHSKNTNCNDSLYDSETGKIENEDELTSNCGTWFALNKQTGEVAEANDNLAALPYDEYLIEEVRISKNEKYLPFETRSFIVEADNYEIEGETWINVAAPEPILPVLPQTGDIPYWIIGLSVLLVLCYITRRWVYYRKY